MAEGLKWKNGNKEFSLTDLKAWIGWRASKGKSAPQGVSRANKFE
jgi:topoisomerase-4 subunit A